MQYLFPESRQRREAGKPSFGRDQAADGVELLLDHRQVFAEVLGDHGLQRALDQLLLVLSEQVLKCSGI